MSYKKLSKNPQHYIKRDIRIDTLRGFMLVSMTINHSLWITFNGLSWLQNYVHQPLGFVSAAEGFVFLSGLVTGIVYGRISWQNDNSTLQKIAFRRAHLVYLTHILTFCWMSLGSLLNLEMFSHFFPMALESNDYYRALGLGVLLLYQPVYHDILPMYCLYVAITPFVITQIKHGRGFYILLFSFTMWVGAQLGVLDMFIHKCQVFIPIHLGFFNILAWQFLFIIGIFFGFQRVIRNEPFIPPRFRLPIFLVCMSLGILLFIQRHELLSFDIIPHLKVLTDKSRLASIRLLNFLILAYLISRLGVNFEKILSWRWFAFLGQHSLQVFAFHIFILYVLLMLNMQISSLGVISQLFIITGVVLSLFVPAYFHLNYAKWKVQKKRTESVGIRPLIFGQ